jgi:hypothetical protein
MGSSTTKEMTGPTVPRTGISPVDRGAIKKPKTGDTEKKRHPIVPYSLTGIESVFRENLDALRTFGERHHHLYVQERQNRQLSSWSSALRIAAAAGQISAGWRIELDNIAFQWSPEVVDAFKSFLASLNRFEAPVRRIGHAGAYKSSWFQQQKRLLASGQMCASRRAVLQNN